MTSDSRTFRSELVSLLRGFFACPLLAVLADLEVTNRMRTGPFTVPDFPQVKNSATLQAAFHYLHSLGLLAPHHPEGFRATSLGEYVLARAGAFHLLRSYRDYFDRFTDLLTSAEATEATEAVRRLENIQGTGQLHARKYFPATLRRLRGRPVGCIVDVGCGSGEFLAQALSEHADAQAVGVDLSGEAVQAMLARFRGTAAEACVRGVVANAADLAAWTSGLPNGAGGIVVTIWFVLHEFSGGGIGPVVRFFNQLHQLCPAADVVVGEIIALPPDALASAHGESIMPELLLFHELSGQGVLSWDEHRDWLTQVPYRLTAEDRYDEVPAPGGPIPSSMVWYLSPHSR